MTLFYFLKFIFPFVSFLFFFFFTPPLSHLLSLPLFSQVELKFGAYYNVDHEWFSFEEKVGGKSVGAKGDLCLSMEWRKPSSSPRG